MPRDATTLFPADATAGEPWRLGRVVDGRPRVDVLPVGPDPTPAAVAAAVGAAGRGTVTLALPSAMCLSAVVDTAGVGRAGWPFRLELALPLSAEETAADFVPHPRQPTALGIAAAIGVVRPWVDALEAAGVTVGAVCPAALLAVDALRPRDGLLAWGHGSAVELFGIAGGQVTGWFAVPADADAARLYAAALPDGPGQLVDVSDAVATALGGGDQLSRDWATAAVVGRPRIDLGHGGLAPRGRTAAGRRARAHAAVAAGVAVAVACGGALWRAHQYQSMADAQLDRQAAIFRQLYPNRPVPADVRGRLRSDARGLATDDGTPTATGGPPAPVVLHGLLSQLATAGVRFRLTDVRVADGAVSVEGTVPTRADADALAAAVRAGTGVPVDVPQTDQTGPRSVHFTLTGTTAPAESTLDRGGT